MGVYRPHRPVPKVPISRLPGVTQWGSSGRVTGEVVSRERLLE